MTDTTKTPTVETAPVVEGTTTGRVPGDIASSEGKLVYLCLSTAGACSVADLVERLGMKRIELFGVLETLEGRGLVEQVATSTYAAA